MVIQGVIPFFGGVSTATHSKVETRVDYLSQTVESLLGLGIRPWIYMTERDRTEIPYAAHRIDVNPIWLPYAACVDFQKTGPDADLVYYTEADQVLHVLDEEVYGIPDDDGYLSPWRLDRTGPNGENENEDCPQYGVDGVLYGIANGVHRLSAEPDPRGVIDVHSQQSAFSGAYLATKPYFDRIPFRKRHVLPVEHASGFDAKSIGTCYKTEWVDRFWVDHLSPRDRHGPSPDL